MLSLDSKITLSGDDTESDYSESSKFLPPFSRTNIQGAGCGAENG